MNNNLLILGAGQYGQVAKETAEAMGKFNKIAFLDDEAECAIGKLADYEKFAGKYSYAFVAIGNAELRSELLQKLEDVSYMLAVIVHPKAIVSPSAQIGKGSIVEAGAVINTNSVVAIGCFISANAVINHNSFVGDCCHIDCNATVPSGVVVYAKTKVRSNVCYAMPHTPDDIEGVKQYCFEDGV